MPFGTHAQIEVCQLAVQRECTGLSVDMLSTGHLCAPNKQLDLVCLCVFASIKGVMLVLIQELGLMYAVISSSGSPLVEYATSPKFGHSSSLLNYILHCINIVKASNASKV